MTDVSLSLSFQAMSQALIQYEGHSEAARAVVTHVNVPMYEMARLSHLTLRATASDDPLERVHSARCAS